VLVLPFLIMRTFTTQSTIVGIPLGRLPMIFSRQLARQVWVCVLFHGVPQDQGRLRQLILLRRRSLTTQRDSTSTHLAISGRNESMNSFSRHCPCGIQSQVSEKTEDKFTLPCLPRDCASVEDRSSQANGSKQDQEFHLFSTASRS
jgi:hypothetical protein